MEQNAREASEMTTDILAQTARPNPALLQIRQICRGERIRRFLHRTCQGKNLGVEISAPDGSVLLQYGPEESEEITHVSSSAFVMVQNHPIASVRTFSDGTPQGEVAIWIAHFLEELLDLEGEVSNLASEIVHTYEELHLLYSLGEALGGVLDLNAACEMIVGAMVTPLNAGKASISVELGKGETVVAIATSPYPPADLMNPAARAEATLQVNGERIGALTLQGKFDAQEFSSGDVKLLEGVAAVAAPAIHSAQLYQVARQEADTDGLTGLLNHRCLHEQIDDLLNDADASGQPLSVVLADLDSFKLFNDVYGHPVGDLVLQQVSESFRNGTRSVDLVGRYGGDEFMIILPNTNAEVAVEVAQRVIAQVEERNVEVDGDRLPLRISVGVASYPDDATTKHELIAHADAALYEAKASGGGQIKQVFASREEWAALQSSSYGALEGLVTSVDAKDHYTRVHSEMVTEAALVLAEALQLSDETQRALRIAGLLHDIGKIGIPDSILKKPGKLTDEEYSVMKQHVQLSEMMIKNVPFINDVLAAVAHHHERYDGRGYPYRKRGEEIPLLGRIMAVADAYSAMSMDRPYRKRMDWEEIRSEMEKSSGSQFDPELVEKFIDAMDALKELDRGISKSSARSSRPSSDDAASR